MPACHPEAAISNISMTQHYRTLSNQRCIAWTAKIVFNYSRCKFASWWIRCRWLVLTNFLQSFRTGWQWLVASITSMYGRSKTLNLNMGLSIPYLWIPLTEAWENRFSKVQMIMIIKVLPGHLFWCDEPHELVSYCIRLVGPASDSARGYRQSRIENRADS